MFDRDKSGGISYHELTSVMYALGQNMTHQEVLDLFRDVDTDGNGEIDFEEFTQMMLKRQAAGKLMTEEEEIMRAFKLFDVNGDGTITSDELRKMMKSLGSDLTQEEVELLIKEADYDGNGELDLAEFTKFMMTK
jgi:Ca2+-binding EF-hand superfamily protein